MAPIRSTLDRDEKRLNNKLDEMYALVSEALDKSLQSLYDHNPSIAARVVDDDKRINALQREIEEQSIRIIALQQPVASDLRTLVSDIYISMELERIADHAAAIARIVLKLGSKPAEIYLEPITTIASQCQDMLMKSLQAYNEQDDQHAKDIAAMDDEIDRDERGFKQSMFKEICSDTENNRECTYLLWIAHNLERIGDRITNIAERIVYIKTSEMPDLNP